MFNFMLTHNAEIMLMSKGPFTREFNSFFMRSKAFLKSPNNPNR